MTDSSSDNHSQSWPPIVLNVPVVLRYNQAFPNPSSSASFYRTFSISGSSSFGVLLGPYRPTTLPSLSIKNFVKFLISVSTGPNVFNDR